MSRRSPVFGPFFTASSGPSGPSGPSVPLLAFALLAALPSCSKRANSFAPSSEARMMAGEDRAQMDELEPQAQGSSEGGSSWQRSTLDTHRIQIEVGEGDFLPLDAVHVQARVDGFRARVLLDIDFSNPHAQQLEGELQLRLPEGASPYFLAYGEHRVQAQAVSAVDLDAPATSFSPEGILAARQQLWSGPKQAVMVERDQAKRAYRQTVRRNVDPAISEWAGAGVFNTRLFPIAGEQRHRVVIGYDVDLSEAPAGWRLPLVLPKDAAERTIALEVAAFESLEVALAHADGQLEAPRERTPELLRYRVEDPPEVLELSLSGTRGVGLTGHDAATGSYFAAQTTPELPVHAGKAGARRAIFAVDVSMSSNPEKFNVWLDLMEEMLAQNRDEIGEFAVMFFNVEQFWYAPSFVANQPEQVAALMDYSGTLALEGATDLDAALDEAAAPTWAGARTGAGVGAEGGEWDLFLLSDGAATWGEPDHERTLRELDAQLDGRVFAYRTGLPGTELGFLQQLARETGGAVFSVTGPDEVAAASTAHRSQPWELLGIEVEGVSDLLVEGAPRFIYPGQALTMAGRLEGADSAEAAPRELDLRVRSLAGSEQTLHVELPAVLATPLAPRVYGQLAVSALERYHALAGEQIDALAYARHFRVTGRAASLLMLESEDDYAQAGLDPATSASHDAATVSAEPAAGQVSAVERSLGQLLGDPRAALLARLHRIETLAPASASDYAELRELVERLPASAFDLDIPALDCARHDRLAAKGPLLDQLIAREPEYDLFTREAERRRQQLGAGDGLKLLSSLIEANPGDTTMARDVAFTAQQWGMGAQVYELLQRVAATRPEEPQTHLALASLAAELGAHDLAMVYYELALTGGWDDRFGSYREIAAVDYMRFLNSAPIDALTDPGRARARLDELRQQLPITEAELLVVMAWNTDNTDVDLHVKEPWGTEVYYSHPSSLAGGRLTRDVTTGYGPEMYYTPRMRRGKYKIRAKYYADDSNRLSTRTKVYVTIFRDFGRPEETVSREVVTLERGKEMHEIATVF